MQRKRNQRVLSDEHVLFGRAVRQMRARVGISQEMLGQQSGLHRNYVGALERGEVNATLRTLRRVSVGLGVSLTELMALFEEEIRRNPPGGR